MVPHVRFEELLSDIEPSPTTKSNAAAAHTSLRNYLWNHQAVSPLLKTDFLSGSYRRDTAVRPRTKNGSTERPDVDIIVVTKHTTWDDPAKVVDSLYWALKGKYDVIRRQGRSVGIETPRADMDVVPIIDPYGDGTYYIADRRQQNWVQTNPPGHTTWTIDVNRATGGRFKPLVKMLKWWRRHNPTVSRRPKGFVIECIAAECMNRKQAHLGELFVGTLETIVERYDWSVWTGQVPHIEDPGVEGSSVTRGMTFEAFEGFYNKAKLHAQLGRRALAENDLAKATAMWRTILGDRFPVTPVRRTEGLLRPAAAASAPLGLGFPNRPAGPVKPDGFA